MDEVESNLDEVESNHAGEPAEGTYAVRKSAKVYVFPMCHVTCMLASALVLAVARP